MIKYSLTCKQCNIVFDSWFASSKEYEKLRKKRLLTCHSCNSIKIEKSIMAPKLINKNNTESANQELKKLKDIKDTIRKYQKFIKNNFEYVGKNFAYEARSIHYDNKKKEKGIYGTASIKEINDLKDEGIKTEMIPWVEEKDN